MPLTIEELTELHQILTDVVLSAPDGADLSKEARLLGRVLAAKAAEQAYQTHMGEAFAQMDRDQDDLMGPREWDNAEFGFHATLDESA